MQAFPERWKLAALEIVAVAEAVRKVRSQILITVAGVSHGNRRFTMIGY
jgi:hypothetical protein